jgi:hypothetical protein
MTPFANSTTLCKIDATLIVIESSKPFANVEALLEALIPLLTPGAPAPPELAIYFKREYDRPRAIQYEIGAGLCFPLRVILSERADGSAHFEYVVFPPHVDAGLEEHIRDVLVDASS